MIESCRNGIDRYVVALEVNLSTKDYLVISIKWKSIDCGSTIFLSNIIVNWLLAISHRSPVTFFGQIHEKLWKNAIYWWFGIHCPLFWHDEFDCFWQIVSVKRHQGSNLCNGQTQIDRLYADIPIHNESNE